METIKLKYGRDEINVSMAKRNVLGIIESTRQNNRKTQQEIIIEALENPIGSRPLRDIVKPGETICIIISDITRAWQKMSLFLPFIVEQLNNAGIRDQDIIFLCATGSHRAQTKEEHRVLLGEELSKRFDVIDHDCKDHNNLAYVGTTSFGTPVWINKKALSCDHMILTGAVVFHDLVGWGGGKKSILPGICGYETIMVNHSLSLSKNEGEGTHPMVKCGNVIDNPLHGDMLEAAGFVKPSFLFNVIMDENGNIGNAVAGDYIKAHEVGQLLVDQIDGVPIKEKADLVIVSAGGYPKDINLYQSSKALVNAKEALNENGTMILLSQCQEGFGDDEVQQIIENYDNNLEREIALRKDYTVAKYTGYLISEIAQRYHIILISDMGSEILRKINIDVVSNMEEALKIAYKKDSIDLKAYFIPNGASTLPK